MSSSVSTTFPENFLWGTATSSYQIEGAVNEGGRGPSIWDAFCSLPDAIEDHNSGATACDHYHLYPQDVKLMKEMGVKAYRFSIAWPRIQPTGKGTPNPEGIAFYNNLINSLLEHGITPWVTLYHWDLPLSLEMRESGWLNPEIAGHFAEYSRICFENFGDRVKNWITLNEPHCSSQLGYGIGYHAPGRSSKTELYLSAHNLLRAHAYAVEIYRQQFSHQNGQIGITNNCDWREPASDDPKDLAAAERALEFYLSMWTDPIYRGDYPESMRKLLGSYLPQFTEDDRKLLLNSSDFFGLNHYTTAIAADPANAQSDQQVSGNGGLNDDQQVILTKDPAWQRTTMGWCIVPWGCRNLLKWISDRYDRPPIFITENGSSWDEPDKETAINDTNRQNFLKGYLTACSEAIHQDNVDLRGYFCWSFMDNFEWAFGYTRRFGLHYVDYKTQERTPKGSAHLYKKIIQNNLVE